MAHEMVAEITAKIPAPFIGTIFENGLVAIESIASNAFDRMPVVYIVSVGRDIFDVYENLADAQASAELLITALEKDIK